MALNRSTARMLGVLAGAVVLYVLGRRARESGALADAIEEIVITAQRIGESAAEAAGNAAQAAVKAAASAFLPRGIRNNNPGNIVRTGERWLGMAAVQSDPRFVVFEAPEWGIRAMVRILRNYAARGMRSVREIISTWAPASENDTAAYVAAVARELGVSPDAPLDLESRMPQLVAAIIRHENGMQPYTADVIQEGIARANV